MRDVDLHEQDVRESQRVRVDQQRCQDDQCDPVGRYDAEDPPPVKQAGGCRWGVSHSRREHGPVEQEARDREEHGHPERGVPEHTPENRVTRVCELIGMEHHDRNRSNRA